MLHYHTKAEIFTIRGALKDVQEELEEWHFVKCNQCYLVNLKYVSEIRKNIAVVGGDELGNQQEKQTCISECSGRFFWEADAGKGRGNDE